MRPLGIVAEAGGGEVRVLVDRDLARYPEPGTRVGIMDPTPDELLAWFASTHYTLDRIDLPADDDEIGWYLVFDDLGEPVPVGLRFADKGKGPTPTEALLAAYWNEHS